MDINGTVCLFVYDDNGNLTDFLCPEDEDGNPVAYSCVGRGADFASVVHEWAGSREDVLATLQGQDF